MSALSSKMFITWWTEIKVICAADFTINACILREKYFIWCYDVLYTGYYEYNRVKCLWQSLICASYQQNRYLQVSDAENLLIRYKYNL